MPRSLIVDSRGAAGPDRARSRAEALQQMTANEYDAIELHTAAPGVDEYGLMTYLAATWPTFLQHVAVRTVTGGRTSAEWNHATSSFVALPAPVGRRGRREYDRPHVPAVAAELR